MQFKGAPLFIIALAFIDGVSATQYDDVFAKKIVSQVQELLTMPWCRYSSSI